METSSSIPQVSPLHSFFANNFPLLQQEQDEDVEIQIVNDNARGLSKADALSERRRLYDAQQQRLGEIFLTPPPSARHHQTGISRWESELPDLLTVPYHSPPPHSKHYGEYEEYPPPQLQYERYEPQRQQQQPVIPPSALQAAVAMVAPKIPQRRRSMEMEENTLYTTTTPAAAAVAPSTSVAKADDDNATVSTAASSTLHSRESTMSSRGSSIRSNEGSADYALAPPRRRTSCLAWLDQVEANDRLVTSREDNEQIPNTRLQPTSRRFSGAAAAAGGRKKVDNPNSLENQLVGGNGGNNNCKDAATTPTSSSVITGKIRAKSRGTKHAPRRPRRMRSMELQDDSLTSVSTLDSSVSSVQSEDDLRLVLSGSIHSVLQKVKEQEPAAKTSDSDSDGSSNNSNKSHNINHNKLTSSEQIILKDAVKGVVGALRRSSQGSPPESPKEVLAVG